MFFNSWSNVLQVVLVGVPTYVGLVFFLRITGKRTLSQLNVFDFVVTVALGSTLATTLLSRDVALVEGLTALATLILLQYTLAWLSVRLPPVEKLIKGDPTLVVYEGEILGEAALRERLSHEELVAVVREHGLPGIHAAHAVVMETNGKLSVLKSDPDTDYSSLDPVEWGPTSPDPRP